MKQITTGPKDQVITALACPRKDLHIEDGKNSELCSNAMQGKITMQQWTQSVGEAKHAQRGGEVDRVTNDVYDKAK